MYSNLSTASLKIKESENGLCGTSEYLILQIVTYQYNPDSLLFPVMLALITTSYYLEIFFSCEKEKRTLIRDACLEQSIANNKVHCCI